MSGESSSVWETHEAQWLIEGRAVRLIIDGDHYFFENQTLEPIRELATCAVEYTKSHFKSMVAGREEEFGLSDRDFERLALQVGLRRLSLYNSFKNNYESHRDHDLHLTLADMQHVYTKDEVLFFSTAYSPKTYLKLGSALTGMTEEQFAAWESDRRYFWDSR